ncbi:MAG TPA: zinc ribbon domain-containing protein [Anaerovoracaceae bacterium]|nr:zinc ribbon domain-containing protein [Anaerovoracaceae bacterium]
MWQMIKNDPILKTAIVIILGVLGFGFAFNIMFGQRAAGSMEGGGEMAGSGYSLDSTLSYILVIAFKLLIITAIIIAIIAVVKLANKYLLKGEEMKMMSSIKNDPVLKAITIIALSIVALLLIFTLFSGVMGVNQTGMNGYIMIGNSTPSVSLAGILAILLKVLLFVSVIGLFVGGAVFLYQTYSKSMIGKVQKNNQETANIICGNCNTTISDEFTYCPVCGAKTKQTCEDCGAELKAEWKCCPSCGKER